MIQAVRYILRGEPDPNLKSLDQEAQYGEPVADPLDESLAVLREVVREMENVLVTPHTLLDAADKRDEAA